jgi:hypothetical protein
LDRLTSRPSALHPNLVAASPAISTSNRSDQCNTRCGSLHIVSSPQLQLRELQTDAAAYTKMLGLGETSRTNTIGG